MKLEFLCEMELSYRDLPPSGTKIFLVRPYNGEEGSGYGEGDGTITGEKINGTSRWVNHPHRRNDGVMLPDLHGVINTQDDAVILFSMTGRTYFVNNTGRQLLVPVFEAEDERYKWLNNTVCVLEGLIRQDVQKMRARVYVCINELE